MDNIQIRFSGSGGQGLQLAAKILSEALILENFKIARSQAYEPTSRGGLSRSDVIVSRGQVDYPLVTALDFAVILDDVAVSANIGLLKDSAVVVVDEQRVTNGPIGDFTLKPLPLIQTAREVGNVRAANIVSLGALAGCGEFCRLASLEQAIRNTVKTRFVDFNLDALNRGFALSGPGQADDSTKLTAVN